jgi:phosphinothricin acetyltransferase
MIVREARTSDLDAVERIYRDYVEDYESGIGRRFQLACQHGLPFLVAEESGAVVGFACASPYRSRLVYRFSVEDSIYVARGWQQREIGRTLLSRLITECANRGLRQMLAVIANKDNRASIRLHESVGFFKVGELLDVGYDDGRCITSVLMQRPLAAVGGCDPCCETQLAHEQASRG